MFIQDISKVMQYINTDNKECGKRMWYKCLEEIFIIFYDFLKLLLLFLVRAIKG